MCLALLKFLFKVGLDLVTQLLNFRCTYNSLSDESFLELLGWGWHLANLFIHNRLRERRLVDLVVTIEAIPNHIKHHILTVLGPILDGEATSFNY